MRPVIFHHVPRSGGTYVRRALAAALGSDFRINWNDSVYRVTDVLRTASKHPGCLLSSHWFFHPAQGNVPLDDNDRSAVYVTWVRNPVDMAYSAYWFYRKSHPGIEIMRKPMYQTLKEIPDKGFHEYVDTVLGGEEPFFPMGVFSKMDFSGFDFVGNADRMEQSLEQLGRLIGTEIDAPAERINVSGGHDYSYRRAEMAERLELELAAVREVVG